jgi:hypothetical protein
MSGKGSSPRGEHRSSALWGTGNRGGDSRSSALWGKSGRGLVTALCAVLVVAAPLAAGARKHSKSETKVSATTYIDPFLLAKAQTQPESLVKVIIQSNGMRDAREAFSSADRNDQIRRGTDDAEQVNRRLRFVVSIAVQLKAKKMALLARIPGLTVTYDAKVQLSALPTSKHVWTTASGVKPLYGNQPSPGQRMPAIAIIDSGIDKNRADFDMGARVIAEHVITKLEPNSPGDGRGHGTFVAGIAAGSAANQAGAAPQVNLVSVDVMDDSGMARTSDVIAAAEWVYQKRHERIVDILTRDFAEQPKVFLADRLRIFVHGATEVSRPLPRGVLDGIDAKAIAIAKRDPVPEHAKNSNR